MLLVLCSIIIISVVMCIVIIIYESCVRCHARRPRVARCPARRPREVYYTPSPPTKSLGFRGFDSSKLLILKGGNSRVRRIL